METWRQETYEAVERGKDGWESERDDQDKGEDRWE